MELSSINTDVLRGNVTTIILGSLWSADRYGYDILKEIELKSDGHFKIKQPTLYNQLKRLEKQGLISSYEGSPDDTGGGRRCYYTLTAEGREFLQKEKSEYEYSRSILDKLVSTKEFDFENQTAPFDTTKLRPYSKKEDNNDEQPAKVIVKEKVVEVEKIVEKKVFYDFDGNEITEEEAKVLINSEIQSFEVANKNNVENLASNNESLESKFAKIEENYVQTNNNSQTLTISGLSDKEQKKHFFDSNNANKPEPKKPATSLKDLFEKIDKELEESKAKKEQARENTMKALQETEKKVNAPFEDNFNYNAQQPVDYSADSDWAYSELDNVSSAPKGQFVTSAVLNQNPNGYKFEKSNINYKDFFASIAPIPVEKIDIEPQKEEIYSPYESDLKTRLYKEGFKIRPYDKGNTSEYYSFNFLHVNRIRRDCSLLTMLLFLAEIAVMWLSLYKSINYVYFTPIICVGIVLCLLPFAIYLNNPTKRIRAEFNLKRSLLNRTMLFIELSIVAILVGVFGLKVNASNLTLLYQSIVLPIVLLSSLPISSLIYWLLYRTKKYHIA